MKNQRSIIVIQKPKYTLKCNGSHTCKLEFWLYSNKISMGLLKLIREIQVPWH